MMTQSAEISQPNFALAYACLASRVSAANAFMSMGNRSKAERELTEAMRVIYLVETPTSVLNPNTKLN